MADHDTHDHTGVPGVGSGAAADTTYDNSTSGLTATDVQAAIDEVAGGGGGGGVSQAYLGYNTIGASFEALTANRIYLKKVTIASACFLSSIDIHLKGNSSNVWDLEALVHADSAGTPTRIVNVNAPAINGSTEFFLDSTARWFSLAMGMYLPAADYWFGFMGHSGACSVAYDTGGSDIYYAAGGGYLQDYSLVGSNTNSTRKYSLRLNTFS